MISWFGVVCEELQADLDQLRPLPGRTLHQVLESIASNYIKGTPNGIRMDSDSGLIWSPSHFTWMDTNFPAATPRQGYPIEIQVLWIRLLRQLERLGIKGDWAALAHRAWQQATFFGAEFVFTQQATTLTADGDEHTLTLSDGGHAFGRAVIITSGVAYRRLSIPVAG